MFKEVDKRKDLIDLAKQFSFELSFEHGLTHMIRFERDGTRIDVWYGNMTVAVYEKHRKAVYCQDVSEEDLVEIFAQPDYIFKLNFYR